jgi:hypothetical protein
MIVHDGCCFTVAVVVVVAVAAGCDDEAMAGICTPVVGLATMAAALAGDS